MLVLSRRKNEKIFFPNLGINVEILRIAGSSVRIGVDAPREFTVLRGEVPVKNHEVPDLSFEHLGALSPRTLNQLNAANLALRLAEKQLQAGMSSDAEQTLQAAIAQFEQLDDQLDTTTLDDTDRSCQALLVEDDANESGLLAGFLRVSGFDVITASDGCHALEYLETHQCPDVVLLDMHMPRCNGPSTISAIRGSQNYEGIRVIAISGTDPTELGVATGPAGVDRWFQKPIDPEELVVELSRDLSLVGIE